MRALVGSFLVMALGCAKEPPPTPSSAPAPTPSASASTAPSTSAEVSMQLEGNAIMLAHGLVHADALGLRVLLAESPITCRERFLHKSLELSISIPPGPGGRFFGGQPLHALGTLSSPKKKLRITATLPIRLELEAVDANEGGHVRGKLSFDRKIADDDKGALEYRGKGAFDLVTCKDTEGQLSKLAVPAAVAPKAAAEGTVGSEPFRHQSALAFVEKDAASGDEAIVSVFLYPFPGVRCDSTFPASKREALALQQIIGARSSDPLPHLAMSASPTFESSKRKIGGGAAWIRFDNLAFKVGEHVRGELVALSAPGGEWMSIGGGFDALVCR